MPSAVCRALIAVLCLVLGLFFGFVGWNKAFAALPDLARYGAWTIYLPEGLGRLIGWSEIILAAGLLTIFLPRHRGWARLAALVLIANQLCAGAVHYLNGETAALPQNAVLIVLLGLVAWAVRKIPIPTGA